MRQPVAAQLRELLANFRKIIVLLADEDSQPEGARDEAQQGGPGVVPRQPGAHRQARYAAGPADGARQSRPLRRHRRLADLYRIGPRPVRRRPPGFPRTAARLAGRCGERRFLPAIKLHKRISEDLDALAEIERNYEKEIRQIFGNMGQRAIELKRERWDDYVAQLKKLYNREQILKENGVVDALHHAAGRFHPGTEAGREQGGCGNLRAELAEKNHRADL